MQRLFLLASIVSLWLGSPASAAPEQPFAVPDRCGGCTGDDCDGCPGQELPVDEVIVGLFAAHAEFRLQAEELAQQKGMNGNILEFLPIRYKTQVVAGTNWFVKVQLNSAPLFADVAIFQPADGAQPKIFGINFGVSRDEPIFESFGIAKVVDRCGGCPGDDCAPGCPGQEMPVDEKVMGLFGAHAEFRERAEELAQQNGMNGAILEFLPIRYKTQLAAGTNWFVKVQLNSSPLFADVAVFEPFSGAQPQITGIKFGVSRDAPINVSFSTPIVV